MVGARWATSGIPIVTVLLAAGRASRQAVFFQTSFGNLEQKMFVQRLWWWWLWPWQRVALVVAVVVARIFTSALGCELPL